MSAAIIGYARVSTDDQNLDLQRDALTRAGCTRLYEDRISGAKAARPGLVLALEVARNGDQLVVWRLDRLGRSMSDLITLTRTLQERRVELRSADRGDRHQHDQRQIHLPPVRGTGGVRARPDPRAHPSWTCRRPRARPQRRSSEIAQSREAPACRRALQQQAAQHRRNLPDHGDFEADAVQLPGRGQWLRPGRAFPTRR
jgi:hypothetical protein